MLDVNRLRVIDAVARHGSVTAAARELHYSQPTVTHHIARLESETGAQLLQRVGRGIRLTPAGQLLAGLGFQPREVMGDRRLGVVQLLRRGGDRAVARDGVDHAQPVDVEHRSTLSMNQLESWHWTNEPRMSTLKA